MTAGLQCTGIENKLGKKTITFDSRGDVNQLDYSFSPQKYIFS